MRVNGAAFMRRPFFIVYNFTFISKIILANLQLKPSMMWKEKMVRKSFTKRDGTKVSFLAKKNPKVTYQEARKLNHSALGRAGFTLSKPDLNVPYATTMDGRLRLWLKPQAVYVSYVGNPKSEKHDFGSARSLHIEFDTRELNGDRFAKMIKDNMDNIVKFAKDITYHGNPRKSKTSLKNNPVDCMGESIHNMLEHRCMSVPAITKSLGVKSVSQKKCMNDCLKSLVSSGNIKRKTKNGKVLYCGSDFVEMKSNPTMPDLTQLDFDEFAERMTTGKPYTTMTGRRFVPVTSDGGVFRTDVPVREGYNENAVTNKKEIKRIAYDQLRIGMKNNPSHGMVEYLGHKIKIHGGTYTVLPYNRSFTGSNGFVEAKAWLKGHVKRESLMKNPGKIDRELMDHMKDEHDLSRTDVSVLEAINDILSENGGEIKVSRIGRLLKKKIPSFAGNVKAYAEILEQASIECFSGKDNKERYNLIDSENGDILVRSSMR